MNRLGLRVKVSEGRVYCQSDHPFHVFSVVGENETDNLNAFNFDLLYITGFRMFVTDLSFEEVTN